MTFLWIAYSAVWVIIFGYLLFLGNKQTRLIKEIEMLKELQK